MNDQLSPITRIPHSVAVCALGLAILATIPLAAWADTNLRQLTPSSHRTGLIISEIMYNPPYSDGFDLEYVELFNTEPFAVDISGFRLAGAINYTFAAGAVLAGRSFAVVAKDPFWLMVKTEYSSAYGPFNGKLDDKGETLQLIDARGSILLEVPYQDEAPWPVAADGAGHSLVMPRPDYGEADPRAWSASAAKYGTPGASDPGPAYPGLCINELLVVTNSPLGPFIEVYNGGAVTQTLTDCWLTDNAANLKFQITNTVVLAPGTCAVFYAAAWSNVFGLTGGGGELYLLSPDRGEDLSVVIDAVKYDDQVAGISRGRFPDGGDAWREFSPPTAGGRNVNPVTRDIVINEIMFNPLSADNADEFIELYNKGTNAIDISGWRMADAVKFTMPPNTVMASNSYLVIAGDAARMLSNYPGLGAGTVVGTFSGSLKDSGERIALEMPAAVAGVTSGFMVVDEVTYGDGWGSWADGGGSSLELVDPRSDNSMAGNWAGSDESSKAPWTQICVTGVLDNGADAANEVHVLLTDNGECVLDDLAIMRPDEANLVANGSFESGLDGWVIDGNHKQSLVDTTDAHGGANALRLIATGGGDTGVNRIESDLDDELGNGETAIIQAWARWRAGSRALIIRLRGNYLEAAVPLDVPANLGTPGARNSRYVTNAGPAIAAVNHAPVLPADGQAVVISARVHDPDGIGAVSLTYRLDPAVTWSSVAMNDAGTNGDARGGDGVYSGTLPGQASNQLVAFYVEGRDMTAPAATNRWPARGKESLVRFGESLPPGVLGSYRMWVAQSNMDVWIARHNLDNELIDGTFVYGDFRVVYDAGTRERGSSFIRPGYGDPDVYISSRLIGVSKNDRVLGITSFNLDSIEQEGGERDPTFLRERTVFAIGRMLDMPIINQRYVHMYLNGWKMGKVYYDTQVPNGDFLEQWSPGDADGALFEVDDWFEFDDTDPIGAQQIVDARLENYTTTGGAKKKARYRWNWEKKPASASDDDYQPIFSLVDAMNTTGTGTYDAVNAQVDWDEWMRAFALAHIVCDWDHYGYSRGKNGFAYKPLRNRWQFYQWDFDFCLGVWDAPTTDLFGSEDPVLNNIFFQNPVFRRAYWCALYDAADVALVNVATVIDSYYDGLTNQGIVVQDPADVKTWIADRRAYIISQLATVNVPFTITTAGGAIFSTTNQAVVIAGTAPVSVKSIRVNGMVFPAMFTTITSWEITVGLVPGTNVLAFQGYNSCDTALDGMTDTISVVYTGIAPPPYGAIVINELMYNPVGGGAEFIELYNTSQVYPLPLANFFLEGVVFAFSNSAVIPPGGYVVVAENILGFTEEYGAQIPLAGAYSGQLDNAGETLRLLRHDSDSGVTSVIDSVTFGDAAPWPIEADGTGPSLQLIDPTRDNNRVANWGVGMTPLYTPGARNSICQSLPAIPDIRINELQPVNTTYSDRMGDKDPWIELVVSGAVGECYLTDDLAQPAKWPLPASPILTNGKLLVVWADGEPAESVTNELHASFCLRPVAGIVAVTARLGGSTQVIDYLAYNLIGAGKSSGLYPDGDVSHVAVMWQPTIGATNKLVPPDFTVSINEWMAANTNTIADPADIAAGMGDPYDDWFELYNPGSNEADLSGCTLSDGTTGILWRIPNGTIIAPDSFLLVWADGDTDQNGYDTSLHVNFKLDKLGEQIILAYEGRTIAEVSFGMQTDDISQGRWPDATTNVQALAPPTPGSYNAVPGHIPPFVDVTNCAASVYVPSTMTNRYCAGTNNLQTVGGMWWANSTGGSGTLNPAPRAWSFTTSLAMGSNVITVTGTNTEGKACSDRLLIHRLRMPFVAITNVVGYHGTAFVAGTNAMPTAAGMWWTCSAGGSGTLDPFPGSWSFSTGIAPGSNVIIVTATNLSGEAWAATASVVRLRLAFVDITNGTGKVVVGSGVATYTVCGTNNSFVAGALRWTNMLNGAAGTAQVSSFEFQVSSIPLALGSNIIALTCTNAAGEPAGDSVIIFRATEPFVDITNSSTSVAMGIARLRIGGTNNAGPAGVMRLVSMTGSVTNYAASIPAITPWTVMVSNLVDAATNVVAITVTNAAGESATDSIQIYRRPRAVVDITNVTGFVKVSSSTTEFSVAGTNNMKTVGGLTWTNALNGASGQSAISNQQFEIPNIPLADGPNAITVWGTNAGGDVASDSVIVLRGADLPLTNGLALWLDASTITGLTNGQQVTTWTDMSGSGNNATQATTGYKPRFITTGLNNLPTVRFNAADDRMATSLNLSAPYSVFIVWDCRGSGGRAIQGSNNWLIGPWGGMVRHYAGDWVDDAMAVTPYQFYLSVAFNTTISSAFHVDGTNHTGNSSPVDSPGTIGLAAQGAYAEPLNGDIAEIIVYTAALSAGEEEQVGRYLADKYALTTTYPLFTPYVDITNIAGTIVVPTNTPAQYIAGINNIYTVGGMWWTNSLGGGGKWGASSTGWTFTATLFPGNNVITVSGTNTAGTVASDSVTVVRSIRPFVDITNANFSITMNAATVAVGGTNNAGPLGFMALQSKTGAVVNYAASIPAATPWSITVSNLVAGATNFVTMTVTNALAQSSNDTVQIYRAPILPIRIFCWTNASSGAWSASANWTNEYNVAWAPVSKGQSNYVLNFNQAGTYTASNDLNNGFMLNQLNFGGPALSLAGNSLVFTNYAATMPQVNQNSTVAIVVNCFVDVGATTTFGGSGSGPVTVRGPVTGVGGLTKSGPGTLTLSYGAGSLGGLATGGSITYDGSYMVHTFTNSGTFTPTVSMGVEVLVVGGGGAGGGRHGGGGAGGGLVYHSAYAVTPQAYTVTVGNGGQPGQDNPNYQTVGSNGQDSVFATIAALGGGGGGSYTAPARTGGGSGGGGAGGNNTAAGLGNQTASGGGIGYGNNGGTGGSSTGGGGGGGAGTVGFNGAGDTGGNGGTGKVYSISGSNVYYAGGGGGGGGTAGGTGGPGGGGNGGINTGTAGAPNTGGGGGGVRSNDTTAQGKPGGSGIVIVRYLSGALPTYSGNTIVSAGTLALGSEFSITTTTNITIAAGATLEVSNSATYAMAASDTYTLGLNASAAGKITAAGLIISNAHVAFNGPATLSSYVLATYTSRAGSNFATVAGLPSGYSINYSYMGSNQIALARLSAAVDITNAHFTVASSVTNTMIGGTSMNAVGFMRLVSLTGATTNYTASIPASLSWTVMVSNLVEGATNSVSMTATNSAGSAATDAVKIYRVYQPKQGDVQAFTVGRGADYGQMQLSWSNGPITVLACTNRTYSTNAANWFVLASGVSTPWTHTAASNFPSVYYRIVSGGYTSQYTVGKYDVHIAPGSIAWISFPFAVQSGCDLISDWFGHQLEARYYSLFDFASLQSQDAPGGTIQNNSYYFDDFEGTGVNWFPTNTTVAANAGYVLFLPQNHGAVKITGIGMVQTNNVTMQIPYKSVPWVGLAYDVVIDMRNSGITNLFQPPRMYSSFDYDYVDSQQTPGGPVWYAEYYRNNWGTGATNFFPSAPGADMLEPGKGYLIFFSTARSGTGIWNCTRPY